MKGIMLRHDGLFIVTGEVVSSSDRDDGGYELNIRYFEQDSLKEEPVEEHTRIIFRNQAQRDDEKQLIPYADIARKMDLKTGSKIMAVVNFPNRSNEVAMGYRVKRSGILSFRDENGEIEGSVISGYVTGYRIDRKMNSVIFMVTAEPDRDGRPNKYEIIVTQRAMARKMLDNISPKNNTLTRAAFRVGKKLNRKTNDVLHELYPCGAYDVLETYNKENNV